MMNREQARAYFESDAWKSLSDYELVRLQLNEERMCVPWPVFHSAIGRVLQRPVFTHEFATNFMGLIAEFEAVPPPHKSERPGVPPRGLSVTKPRDQSRK